MPVTPGNRLNTAFPVRLMCVLPAICPQEGKTGQNLFLEGCLLIMTNWNLITCQGVRIIFIAPLEFAIFVIVIPAIASGLPCRFCQFVKENLTAVLTDFLSKYGWFNCQYWCVLN